MTNRLKQHMQPYLSCIKILIGWLPLLLMLSSCSDNDAKQEQYQAHKQALSEILYKTRPSKDSLLLLVEESSEKKDYIATTLYYKELGKIMRDNARFSDAIGYHQEGLDAALRIKDTIEIVQALNNLGTDFRRIGAFSEAADYHYQALNYAETYSGANTLVGIKNSVVSMNGIGNISLSLGYYDDAEKYFRKALKNEINLKSYIGQAINYANLGAIFENREQYDSARVYYERSMEQNRLAKSDMGIGLCHIHFGNLHKKEKNFLRAKEAYREAYKLMENISDRWHWLEACLSIAEISLLTNNVPEFNTYINRAERTATEINSPEHMAAIYRLKHDYNIHQGNYRAALENFRHSQAMQDSIVGIQKANRYVDLRVNTERNRNLRQIEQIEIRNQQIQQKKQATIYASWFMVVVGIVVIALLFYAYKQRSRSNKMLRELERIRSDFFTNITHEFRTPLTVILGLNERINRNKAMEEQEKKLLTSAIHRQGVSLLNLVNQLLEISKLKSGTENPEWRHGDVVGYLRMTVEAFELYAREKNIDLQFYSETPLLQMDLVPFYIDKIVGNLLSNAIKHSGEDDKITLSIAEGSIADTVVIRVADTGEGMSEKELERIFDMFYQSPNSSHGMGTGIGLSFTQMLVNKMNGKIEVESQLGAGSIFTVTLPVKNKLLTTVEPLQEDLVAKQQPAIAKETDTRSILSHEDTWAEDEPAKPAQPIVLIVEDNRDVAMYIKTLLNDQYAIITARNGEEGLLLAEKYIPDIVITDVMMPVKDGLKMSCEMKHSLLLNHIPIIILTAKSSDEDKIDALKCGVDAYIRKPFQSEELIIRIEKILENRRLLKQKYMNLIRKDGKVECKDHETDFIQKVTNLIHVEIQNSALSPSFLAEKLRMSTTQLNRKLNAVTGYSTGSYLLQVKLLKAKKMLLRQDRTISEVADACGFYDAAYFSRAFKKEFGVSPSKFHEIPQ